MNNEGYIQHELRPTFQRSSQLFARELITLFRRSCFSQEHSLGARPLRSLSVTYGKSWRESIKYNCSYRRCSVLFENLDSLDSTRRVNGCY